MGKCLSMQGRHGPCRCSLKLFSKNCRKDSFAINTIGHSKRVKGFFIKRVNKLTMCSHTLAGRRVHCLSSGVGGWLL